MYRPPDRALATGDYFHGGSSWTRDAIPLHGTHFGNEVGTLDVRGKTVRFVFAFETISNSSPLDFERNILEERPFFTPAPDRDLDWGWRIGGLAVVEGDRFARDLTIDSAELDVAYDPLESGVGPGTLVPLRVVVRNDGMEGVSAADVRVHFVGDLVGGGEVLASGVCSGQRVVGSGSIAGQGGTRNVTHREANPFGCRVPSMAELDQLGGIPAGTVPHLSLRTYLSSGQDDFHGNVQERIRGMFPLQVSPGAFLEADVNIREASVDTPRNLVVTFGNSGNVPLEDVEVRLNICLVRDDQCLNRYSSTWTLDEELELNEKLRLTPSLAATPLVQRGDMDFLPPERGTYLFEAVIDVPGVTLPENRVVTRFEALEELYQENLDEPPFLSNVMDGELEFTGTPGVWNVQDNSLDGSRRLMAGDLATGDIPADTDASIVLPAMDLGMLKRASLSFNHRYNLEEGFDAARVEISTDGGETWEPLVPRPQPLNDLSEGYPSTALVGSSDLLGDEVECSACVFTGQSETLPGSVNGWLPVEIDLTRHPAFWVTENLESFRFDEMEPHPLRFPTPDYEFRHDSWILDEPGARTHDRYWWIHDATYSEPRPLTQDSLWWSGSVFSQRPSPPVNTNLSFKLDPIEWDAGPLDDHVIRFWDWRAGWRGVTDETRPGTGGEYHVVVNGERRPVEVVEKRPDGWTQREVLIGPTEGEPIAIEFTYLSGRWPGIEQNVFKWNSPRQSGCPNNCNHNQGGFSLDSTRWLSENQNNLGWFIDQIQVLHNEDVVYGNHAQDEDDWSSTNHPSATGNVAWARIPLTGIVDERPWAQEQGWHVSPVDVPGQGTVNAWRFGSSDGPGYSGNADNRLVTPRMDLRFYLGDTATFRFDHSYGFVGGGLNSRDDGGTVNYQVYDEATGTYGPWRTLTASQEVPEIGFKVAKRASWLNGEFDLVQEVNQVHTLGYPAVSWVPPSSMEGFDRITGRTEQSNQQGTDGIGVYNLPDERPRYTYTTGEGAGFEDPVVGYIRQLHQINLIGMNNWYHQYMPWQPYPFVPVFSGNSSGWDTKRWDVSHLIGEQVRFSFHAWTSPRGSNDFVGWNIANVGMEGQRFQGEEALIRFRLVTDESNTKGEWSIDDVRIVGERYGDALAFRSDAPRVTEPTGSTVPLEGELRNLGANLRMPLALRVDPRDADGEPLAFSQYRILQPEGLDLIPAGNVYTDAGRTLGPFHLDESGTMESVVPIRIEVDLPQEDGYEVEVHLEILEGVCGPDGTCHYVPVNNDRGAPLPATTWRAIGETRTQLQFQPPVEGLPGRLVADPPVPGVNETVTFTANLVNDGTTTPQVTLDWSVQEVLRKGSPQQRHTTEILGEEMHLGTINLGTLGREESKTATASFTPEREGLYRLKAEAKGDGQSWTQILEFMVGEVEPQYLVDFSQTNATDVGWGDASERGHPDLGFRQVGTQFIWGVSHAQQNEGLNYCSEEFEPPGCNTAEGRTRSSAGDVPDPPDPVYGLHGIGVLGQAIDLGTVPGDRTILTLRHGHNFEAGDGAVLEVKPLRSPVVGSPRAAFVCERGDNTADMWFRLYPDPVSDYRGSLQFYREQNVGDIRTGMVFQLAERRNPIGEGGAPVIGGHATDSETIRFFLDQRADPICPDPHENNWRLPADFEKEQRPDSLVNYTLQLRLRVGTTPGATEDAHQNECPQSVIECPNSPRQGAMGWQLDSISILPVEVAITPQERVVPMFDGYPKEFRFLLTNHGVQPDTFSITLDENRSQPTVDPAWFSFPEPEVTLLPGETRVVTFQVGIPEEDRVQRGEHTAILRASSSLDPSVGDTIEIHVDLRDHLLPDLALQLEPLTSLPEADGIPQLEAGTNAEFRALVFNHGNARSEPVDLQLEAVTLVQGEEVRNPIGTLRVDALDPRCADDDDCWLQEFRWTAPENLGTYWIEGVVDPDGRLVQPSLANSRASLQLQVMQQQRPAVAVEDLWVDGLGEDGLALEGGFVTITANLTNQGPVSARGVNVQIEFGGEPLLETPAILNLLPGQTDSVSVVMTGLPAGESTIRVFVRPDDPERDPWPSVELRRTLLVRGLDLQVMADPEPVPVAPGDSASTTVHVANDGNAVERIHFRLDPRHDGWGLIATPNPLTVAPNSTAFSVLTLRAPADAQAGAYDLVLQATPQSNPGGRQLVDLPLRVDAKIEAPRIIIEDQRMPPGPGELPLRLESRSNAQEDLRVSLHEPDWGTQTRQATLAAHGDVNVTLPLEVPSWTPPGETPVVVHVTNATGTPLATGHAVVNITARPAGTAAWSDQVHSPEWDLETRVFEFTAKVTNTGNVPFRPDLHVTGLSEGAQSLSRGPHPVVMPQDTVEVPVALRVSAEFTGHIQGSLEVYMVTDLDDQMDPTWDAANPSGGNSSQDAPAAENPGNLSASAQRIAVLELPALAALPDLEITRVTVRPQGAVAPEDPVHVTVTLRNSGFAEAPSTRLFTYVNGDYTAAYDVPALRQGEEARVNFTWRLPETGEYLVQLVADGPGDVLEVHTDNNAYSAIVHVEPGGLTQRIREAPHPAAMLFVLLTLLAAALIGHRQRHGPWEGVR